MNSPIFYIIIGSLKRGEIIHDLISGMKFEGETAVLTDGEAFEKVSTRDWNDLGDADRYFFVLNPKKDLVDQLERVKGMLDERNWELTRAISILDSEVLSSNDALRPWYEAAVHFSDYAIFANHKEVPHAKLKSLVDEFRKKYHPCIFEITRKDRVKNPAIVLEQQTRRISHFFEHFEDTDTDTLDLDIEIASEDEDENNKVDPYMERDPRGKREITLPLLDS